MNLGLRLVNAANNSAALLRENSPLILTCASVALQVTSTAMAVSVTPQAVDIYRKIMADDSLNEEEKRLAIAHYILPLYGPSVLTGGMAIGANIASYHIQKVRLDRAYEALAGLSTAYILAEDKLEKYKESIVEKFGEHVEEEIEDTVLEEQAHEAAKDPLKKKAYISNAGPEIEMEDGITGQHFMGTKEKICFYFADLWTRLEFEECIAASDYLYEIGCTQCAKGDGVGWVCGSRPWPKFTKIAANGDDSDYCYIRVDVDVDPGFDSFNHRY